jgi:SagB-type dehydrogenase family enzyme
MSYATSKKILVTRSVMPLLVFVGCCVTPSVGFTEELTAIDLTKPQSDSGVPLMKALALRRSERSFSAKELPLETLSNLLWAAGGVNRPDSGKRTVPSAVNRQEIDIYVAMKKGLYLYNAQHHVLSPVMAGDIRRFSGVQDFTEEAPVNLIYVADFARMSGDEDDKIFYSATDTGFISQNVYLFCASEGLSTVVLGWVDKPALAEIMNLKKEQRVILTQPVGYPE